MNHKSALIPITLMVVLLSTTPIALGQDASGASVQAYYRDVTAVVYDKVRGVYGKDYSYDWGTNKYTTLGAPSSPSPSSSQIKLDGLLSEDVWKGIQPVTISLEPTYPWGGGIKSVSIRAANNGTWIFMALQWQDSTRSIAESPRVKKVEGGFFYNATHYYSDNLFVGWWMKEGRPTVQPWFNAHYAGTTLGRVPWKADPTAVASVWGYKAYIADDDSNYWPLHYTSPRAFRWGPFVGQPLAHPYSYMVTLLLNSTANYLVGTGVAHVSGCAFPGGINYPWDIRANGEWRDGMWTLEVARPFVPHPQNVAVDASITLQSGRVYSIFLGAGDGQHGENEDVGAMSPWLTLYMEPRPVIPIAALVTLVAGAIIAAVLGLLAYQRGSRGVGQP